jgi:branched-chain amino acid transport system substrate-binding protein
MASPSNDSPLKVGFILPLSGDWAFLGNGVRDGARMAQDDLRARGTAIELLFEDNRGELAPSATIASRLISERGVHAIVTMISGVGKIVQPLAANASIAHIGICSDTDVADGRNNFINYLTAEQGTAKFIEHFSRTFPQGSLGIFALNEAGFERIVRELTRQSLGKLTIVRIEHYNKGTNDFRSQLMKMKSLKPDSILLLGLSPELEIIAKQARTLQLGIPFVSIEGFGLAADKSYFEGQWFID